MDKTKQSTEEKTRRAQLTEDQPTSGLNPTETSRPIQERDERDETDDLTEDSSVPASGRKILAEDNER